MNKIGAQENSEDSQKENRRDCSEDLRFLTSINGDESFYIKFKKKVDRCVYGYFSFYWSLASFMVSQVLSGAESAGIRKFKSISMETIRLQPKKTRPSLYGWWNGCWKDPLGGSEKRLEDLRET